MPPRGVERPRGRCGATVRGAALGACGFQARSCSRTVSCTKRLSHLSQPGSPWRSRAGRAPGLAVRDVRRATRMTARPSRPLLPGRAFVLSVSPSPVGIRLKLPPALQPLQQLLPAGGTGCGLAFGGPLTPENALRRRARKRARSPPPGPMSATKPQLEPYGQAAPLALRISARSRLPDGSKWASPSSASSWGHLNRRRRPQARRHVTRREILTASMVLIRCVKVTVGSCLGPSG